MEAYTYLYDVVRAVQTNQKIPIDEFNLIGSRKSGKTVSLILLWVLLALIAPNKFGFVMLREMFENTQKIYDDVINMLNAYGVEYTSSKSEKQITVNGNVLYIHGVSSKVKTKGADLTGLPHFSNVRYIFVFFEERFEFSEDQVRSAKEAVRSVGVVKPQIITLNACNP